MRPRGDTGRGKFNGWVPSDEDNNRIEEEDATPDEDLGDADR
jgi:hypothetical protein